MILNENGSPTYLGFAVEPHWGSYWVEKYAMEHGLTYLQAMERLENKGKPLSHAEAFPPPSTK